MNGNLEMLKYVHEKKCPWDADTCLNAVELDRLDCLKYAVENKCSWDKKKCLKIAKKFKNKSIIIFIENEIKKDQDKVADNSKISNSCDICKKNKKCIAYKPCGHLISCWSCYEKTKKCSVCNKKIFDFLRIFFP
jgi:hypothetical protein